jgi:hypothetical protein
MTHPILPAQSYEEALPILRAPYPPSQVRALVIRTPDNVLAPCSVALYAIGETAMDRFNLVCARQWSRVFETINETERRAGARTFYYCEVRAIVVAFGQEHDDIGEAEAESHGAALMNARAQAWKRGARWHGPGQCLYAAEQILLRRSDKDDELFVPKGGTDPHKHPYMKKGGQERCRREYQQWLTDSGEAIFGEPLDHLELYKQIARRSHRLPAGEEAPALPPAPIAAQRADAATPAISASASADQSSPDEECAEVSATGPSSQGGDPDTPAPVERLPMPDEPAAPATVKIAESIDYDAELARALSNLARDDGQTGGLTERQQSTVLNWMVLSSDLKLTSEQLVKAVTFLAAKRTCQEARQASFTRWLAAKTSGTTVGSKEARGEGAPASQQPDASGSSSTPGAASQAEPNGDEGTSGDADARTLETDRALIRIHRAMDSHGYPDKTVTQLAALSVGVGPSSRVDWAKVPPQTMGVLADLLESAGSLKWTPETLSKEVLKAHNSTHQSTPAGRFSAFAGQLMDLAESRSVEAA